MQNVPKKKHAVRRHSRILLLIFAVYLDAVVTLASFEPEQLAVRTNKGCSRSHYPFYGNTFGIQFVESAHFR